MKGSVSKKGNKYYYALYRGRDKDTGKKKYVTSKGFRTKQEAEHALAIELGAIARDEYVLPDKMTFSQYVYQWLESYGVMNLKQTTLEGYYKYFENHILPNIGEIPIQVLKPFHLQTLYHKLLTKGRVDGKGGLSGKTVGQVHRIISKALNDAVKLEVVSRNVAKKITPPKAKKYEVKVVSLEDIPRFLELYENNKVYIAVVLALNLGLRRGEVLGLQWGNVDFSSKRIHISKNLVNTTDGPKLTDPKTDKSVRTLMISDQLIVKLRDQKLRQELFREKYGDDYVDNGFVVTRDNGEIINPGRFSHNFKDVILASEWAKEKYLELRFHDLRHSNATILMASGTISPKIISSRLGHSNIGITMDLYMHANTTMQQGAVDELDQIIYLGGKDD